MQRKFLAGTRTGQGSRSDKTVIEMKQKYVTIQFRVSDYTNKVLNAVKKKYSLRSKAEAVDKFVELFAEDLLKKLAATI